MWTSGPGQTAAQCPRKALPLGLAGCQASSGSFQWREIKHLINSTVKINIDNRSYQGATRSGGSRRPHGPATLHKVDPSGIDAWWPPCPPRHSPGSPHPPGPCPGPPLSQACSQTVAASVHSAWPQRGSGGHRDLRYRPGLLTRWPHCLQLPLGGGPGLGTPGHSPAWVAGGQTHVEGSGHITSTPGFLKGWSWVPGCLQGWHSRGRPRGPHSPEV